MPISKDTKPNNKIHSDLFPPTLRNKKLKRDIEIQYGDSPTFLDYLEDYLKSENPEFLLKAVKECPELFQAKGKNLDVEQYLMEKGDKTIKPSTLVDPATIVAETIRWWQQLYQFVDDKNYAKQVKRYLSRILSPLEIIPRGHEEIIAGDGLKHVNCNKKGKKPFLTFSSSAHAFIKRYELIKKVFGSHKSKTRYLFDRDLIIKDTMMALKELGMIIEERDVQYSFNLSDAHTKAISLICEFHIKCCPLCKMNGLSDASVLRVLKLAKKTIRDHSN